MGATASFWYSLPRNPMEVGDEWIVSITGATPNAPVTVNNNGGGFANVGTTDSNGNFGISGTCTNSQIGSWNEIWMVGGVQVGTLAFTINANTTVVPPSVVAQAIASGVPVSAAGQAYAAGVAPSPVVPAVTQSSVVAAQATAANPITTTASPVTNGGTNTPVPTTSNPNFTFSVLENPMQVGDTWAASITNAQANSAVVVSGGMNGVVGNINVGTTNANGNFSLSGTCTVDEIGDWTEQWIVGGDIVGNVSFSIVAANTTTQSSTVAAQTGASTSTSVNALTAGAAAVTTTPTTPSSDPFSDFMTGVEALFSPSSWSGVFSSGDFVQIAGLVSIPAVALYFMMSGQHKGRRG